MAKISISEHILPIFIINFINILAKTKKYKESFNGNFSKTLCTIFVEIQLIIKFCLPFSLQ